MSLSAELKQCASLLADQAYARREDGSGGRGVGSWRGQHHRCWREHSYCEPLWPPREDLESRAAGQTGQEEQHQRSCHFTWLILDSWWNCSVFSAQLMTRMNVFRVNLPCGPTCCTTRRAKRRQMQLQVVWDLQVKAEINSWTKCNEQISVCNYTLFFFPHQVSFMMQKDANLMVADQQCHLCRSPWYRTWGEKDYGLFSCEFMRYSIKDEGWSLKTDFIQYSQNWFTKAFVELRLPPCG